VFGDYEVMKELEYNYWQIRFLVLSEYRMSEKKCQPTTINLEMTWSRKCK